MMGNDKVPLVYYNDTWSPICGHYFWNNDNGASLFCQKLGYENGTVSPKEIVPHTESYSVDSVRIGKCYGGNHDLMGCTGGCNDWRVGGACYENENANCSAGQNVKIRITCNVAQNSSAPKNNSTCEGINL